MNKWITAVLIPLLIAGCTETKTLSLASEQSDQATANVADLSWTKLDIPGQVQFNIDQSSQLLLNDKSSGPVAGFVLPGDKGSLDVRLETFVSKEMTFYAPEVFVLNAQNQIVISKSFKDFKYVPAKFFDDDKFVLTFTVIPDSNRQKLRLLIFTSSEDLKGQTPILHPAKAFARARHTVEPDIDDPLAKHVPYGHFRLAVNTNKVATDRVMQSTDNVPSGANLGSFYKKEIRKAVEAGNISKALSLLEEAKKFNVEGAKETFIESVNNSR
ncbi:MalM family protein [Vibrio salinus]|uniref:MalM family protein n=1 Tax=Vibrio salinus TaxID=2899784 RepID=UPI001E65049A|nr:MalM family protein [Vibrio salinus]MCE0495947.1 MalM family protein [Vibrio salinus]